MFFKFAFFIITAAVPRAEAKLDMPDYIIQYHRDAYIEFMKGLLDSRIMDQPRFSGPVERWQCEEDFKEYRKKGWMDDEDIEQWRRNKVSPRFTSDGKYHEIRRLCGRDVQGVVP